MNHPTNSQPNDAVSRFEEQSNEAQTGIVREFVDFLRCNKKWWLAPIIVVLVMVGLLIVLGSSAAAPFIYTLF